MNNKKIPYLLVNLVVATALTACSANSSSTTATNSTSKEAATPTNSTSNTGPTGTNTETATPNGGMPGNGMGGGKPPSIANMDLSKRVTDIAAVMLDDSTTNTSSCSESGANAQILCLAQAFEKSLTVDQVKGLKYELTAKNAAVWSNFPAAVVKRNGLNLAELSADSVKAFKALANAALGDSGYMTMKSIMLSDEFAGRDTGNTLFDADNYYIAVLGQPSATDPWMLQIGGHHFAANFAYNRNAPSATPMFDGVEPVSFKLDGINYAPLTTRHDTMYNMIKSLNNEQLASAKLSKTFDDVLVGPGQDGKFPASEGILVSQLNDEQKEWVKKAIEAWVNDTNKEISKELLVAYLSDEALSQIKLAWSKSTDSSVSGSYVRIDGPRVWIEFSIQGSNTYKGQTHYHTVWRDKVADYGGSFSG